MEKEKIQCRNPQSISSVLRLSYGPKTVGTTVETELCRHGEDSTAHNKLLFYRAVTWIFLTSLYSATQVLL